MNIRTSLATAMTAVILFAVPGCAVTRGQESVGDYIDDSAITARIKVRYFDSKEVNATAISVETMKGTVLLTGFARNATEKNAAESIARGVNGVISVTNEITVRP